MKKRIKKQDTKNENSYRTGRFGPVMEKVIYLVIILLSFLFVQNKFMDTTSAIVITSIALIHFYFRTRNKVI